MLEERSANRDIVQLTKTYRVGVLGDGNGDRGGIGKPGSHDCLLDRVVELESKGIGREGGEGLQRGRTVEILLEGSRIEVGSHGQVVAKLAAKSTSIQLSNVSFVTSQIAM